MFIQRSLIGLLLLAATVVVMPACDESAPTDALSPEQPEFYRVSSTPVRDYSLPVVYADGKRQSVEEAEAFKLDLTPAELERDWELKILKGSRAREFTGDEEVDAVMVLNRKASSGP